MIGALVQWGDAYNPYSGGATSRMVDAAEREPVSLAFLTPAGDALGPAEVAFVPGPAARVSW